MPFLFSIVTSTDSAYLVSSDARRAAPRSLREDSWENEGGHLAGARPAIASSAISASDADDLQAQVRVMETSLASDFADGRVGTHHNTYAHRSRVLRQQKANVLTLRVSIQSPEQQS